MALALSVIVAVAAQPALVRQEFAAHITALHLALEDHSDVTFQVLSDGSSTAAGCHDVLVSSAHGSCTTAKKSRDMLLAI